MSLENFQSVGCVLPWLQFYLDSDGQPKACCNNEDRPAGPQPQLRNFDDLLAEWNSPYFREIRSKMLSGQRPSACYRCYDRENKGFTSTRKDINFFFGAHLPIIHRDATADGMAVSGLRSIDFRLGSTCNLRCRMCNPRYSSGLKPEWQSLGIQSSREETSSNWFESEDFWKDVLARSPQLEHITVAGGETLLSKRFHWLIDYLIEQGMAHRLTLHFHTNLTVINEATLKKLEKFRSVVMRVSLDGTGSVNSYIRHPSNWEKLVENVHLVDRWAKWPFTRVFMNVTVQAYNILNIPELIDFSLSLENFRPPKLQPIQEPMEFKLCTLPANILAESAARLRRFLRLESFPIAWASFDKKKFHRNITELIAYVENVKKQEGFHDLIARTQAQDQYRKQSVHDFIPELSHLFKK